MNHRIYWLLVLVLAWMMNPPRASACNIPVFRYALERWRSNAVEEGYRAVVFARTPLTAQDEKRIAILRSAAEGHDARANLIVLCVDPRGQPEGAWHDLWQKQGKVPLPWMVVRYYRGEEYERTIWSGPLQEDAARELLHSPARRQLAQRLMTGDSIVWLLLESGDKERDEAAAVVLQENLRKLEESLKLPDLEGDDTVKLLSKLPLKLTFSTLRVRRTDSAEKLLIEMLLHSDSDLAQSTEPMVFPVFGRGRALDALIGKGINADTIQDAAKFLCGACSCEAKRLNPGVDLLIEADWDALLESRDAPRPSHKGERVPIPTPNPRRDADKPESDSPSTGESASKSFVVAVVLLLIGGVVVWRRPARGERDKA
jgi:LPXTG-motif cell wall-anchored protein